jgi:alkanesulfonate monooxygenase SsuD/methylene tetrahydromethanopterin reductase-like flavin-dependent oxidoreductase (luciferase family)
MMRVGVKPGQWGWSFDELEASWRAAEDAGFDLLSCFDHVTSAPEGQSAWDGPSLLAAMAAATAQIRLGIHVLNASLRHPLLVAGQIAVAQAASGGRMEVGVGAGSHYFARYDHEATGLPFPSFAVRMDRLESYCRLLPALWRGEKVTEATTGLREASLGPLGIEPPPIYVGGASERALRIAAQYGDGWHAPGKEGEFASLSERLDRICSEAGRASIPKSTQIRPGDLDQLKERVERLEGAGAATVILVLDADQRGPDWVRRLAEIAL